MAALPKQQAHANRVAYTITGIGLVSVTLVYFLNRGSFFSELSTPDFGESMNLLPEITYKLDSSDDLKNAGTKIVLIPQIIRGKYLKPQYGDLNVNLFSARAICSPISQVQSSTDLSNVSGQCKKWFTKNKMIFPHQALGVRVDKLDTLLLPKLEYDLKNNKLTILATSVSYTNTDGSPSNTKSDVTNNKQVSWQRLSPSFPELEQMSGDERKALHMCHHAPELSKMQHPLKSTNGKYYYDMPARGISHLHKTGHEFFIVSLYNRLSGNWGYYWVVDAPWPNGYQELQFSKTKYIDPAPAL
ncbi:hypothetical protein GZ77_00290 [Endozoicomonas montiporae]|uniref:Uncharacterized protein n=2 Tax=Endozoicomonas montiporae TaxID=1027273 RepID=A0A081N9Q4_9GAMM|nr:hypothetical protein [Endozoicomonas montiporae]KEQ15177.1 hypothetical protein GZ77_00290 [Endozoicomonas montiporae]